MKEKEIWKPIEGFREYYRVSNLGRVKGKNGKIVYSRIGPAKTQIRVMTDEGKPKTIMLARLIATIFIGPPPNPTDIVHRLDGDSTNLRVSNLMWMKPLGSRASKDEIAFDIRRMNGNRSRKDWS